MTTAIIIYLLFAVAAATTVGKFTWRESALGFLAATLWPLTLLWAASWWVWGSDSECMECHRKYRLELLALVPLPRHPDGSRFHLQGWLHLVTHPTCERAVWAWLMRTRRSDMRPLMPASLRWRWWVPIGEDGVEDALELARTIGKTHPLPNDLYKLPNELLRKDF